MLERATAGWSRPRGILFDKDGTLFDFQRSWGGWFVGLIGELAEGDQDRAAALAEGLGVDLATARVERTSPVVAEALDVLVALIRRVMPEIGEAELTRRILLSSAAVPQVPAAPLAPLLDRLRAAGCVLGVATNDAEAVARSHLETEGVLDRFALVLGYDSGHGAKPGPGMPRFFCRHLGLAPTDCLMVGDSVHDLDSGRAAGLRTVAVLTGTARTEDLAAHAEAVLPDIGHLPAWLGLETA